jgi:hypothetical protein
MAGNIVLNICTKSTGFAPKIGAKLRLGPLFARLHLNSPPNPPSAPNQSEALQANSDDHCRPAGVPEGARSRTDIPSSRTRMASEPRMAPILLRARLLFRPRDQAHPNGNERRGD